MGREEKVRNNSIDIFRYICAILVVSIHTHPFEEINVNLSYFFVQIIPRIAVPFFFAISGYYYIKKITQEGVDINKIFWKYTMRLLIVYSLWSLIYIAINFIIGIVQGTNILTFLKETVMNYFFYGSYYHLWFFPALFFALIVTTFFVKIRKLKILVFTSIILYIIGCLGCSYYAIGNQIPLIKELINLSFFRLIRIVVLMGLPFFVLGYFVNALQDKIDKQSNKINYIWISRYYNCICIRNYIS